VCARGRAKKSLKRQSCDNYAPRRSNMSNAANQNGSGLEQQVKIWSNFFYYASEKRRREFRESFFSCLHGVPTAIPAFLREI